MRLAALTYSAMRARSTTQQLAEIALHDVDKLPLEELDGGRHKRQRQHLGHHVGALFQAVKRHDERARAGRRGQQLERYLRQNAQRTERTFINTFSAKRTLYGVKFQKIHAAAPLNDLLSGQNGEQRVSLAGGVALKVNLLLALGVRTYTRPQSSASRTHVSPSLPRSVHVPKPTSGIRTPLFKARYSMLVSFYRFPLSCFPRVCKVCHPRFHSLYTKAPNFFCVLRIFSLQSAVIRRILFIAAFFRKDFVS